MLLCRLQTGVAVIATVTLVSLTAGCAGTAPKPTYTHEIVPESRISMLDHSEVKVDAAKEVKILPLEEERLTQEIASKIEARRVRNVGGTAARNFEVDLHVTRYDKGNAFARAMLAGLGQIHIEGTVTVFQMPEHTLVGSFDLKKTFAWGGIYGASTSMDDIQNTFADGVAAAVTGQPEDEPQKTKS
jgi:hypothetical protein